MAVLSGFAYFGQIVAAEAKNGHGSAGAFFSSWTLIWIVAWVLFYVLLRIGNAPLLFIGTTLVIFVASWLFLRLNSNGWESNRSLSIGIGGGMGLFLLLNVWGIVWRANKKILRWMGSGDGTTVAMPSNLGLVARQ
ncbi:MAG TPA: hypothetical protein VG498_17510, partial [Terriglobales bacterium]|nr:hypothetical protein [Terriglobales bacterium]